MGGPRPVGGVLFQLPPKDTNGVCIAQHSTDTEANPCGMLPKDLCMKVLAPNSKKTRLRYSGKLLGALLAELTVLAAAVEADPTRVELVVETRVRARSTWAASIRSRTLRTRLSMDAEIANPLSKRPSQSAIKATSRRLTRSLILKHVSSAHWLLPR